MRRILFITIVLLSLFALSCKTNHLSGVYVCDQSSKKADTTIHHGNSDEVFIDFTCTFTAFDFKGNSTVEINMANGNVASSYVVDKDYVRIKGTGSDILLKLQDQNTLTGEGIAKGIYYKK
jgi:hypothetical protein